MKILAIDIGGTNLKVLELDDLYNVLSSKEVPSDAKNGGVHLMNRVIETIRMYDGYSCIGVSTAGQVNEVTGEIIYAGNIPMYAGMNVKNILEKEFSVPIYVDNDVNAVALGELYLGNGKNYSDFICLTYGTGVGGAIVINNELYRGKDKLSAEFGHMITHYKGSLCACGRNGCYEKYASTSNLVARAKELNSDCSNGRAIIDMYYKDIKIKQLLDEWIDEVVVGIINLVHIFNIPSIVLGGGIMEQDFIVNEVRKRVKAGVMSSYSTVNIVKATLGNKTGALGVGYKAMQYLK